MGAVYTIWLRTMKRYFRSKGRIIGTMGMPLFFLLILGFGLNPVLKGPGGVSYLHFITPGIIAMSVLFTAMFSGIQILWDKQFGFLKETLVAPVSRFRIMLGQAIGGATTSVMQGMLIWLVSLLVGGALGGFFGFFITIGFMALIGLAFTSLGIVFASRMSDMQAFPLIMNFVIFPVFLLSGALFPLESLPPAMRWFVSQDPLTYGVEGMRYGLLGISQINPLFGFLVLSGFALMMILLGGWLFQKIKV